MKQLNLLGIEICKIRITKNYSVITPEGVHIDLKGKIFTALIHNNSALFFYEETLGYHIRINNLSNKEIWKIVG